MNRPELKVTNTFSRRKETFVPVAVEVFLYVCGITPYDFAHVGHGRCYVHFDIVYRTLQFLGYPVTYVRNVTDIDDKLIAKAQQNHEGMRAIAEKYMHDFEQDMEALGCQSPQHEPRVTAHIPHIIAFIQSLIEKEVAYSVGHDVYFDVSQVESYGALSGKHLDELIAGARVAVAKDKRNPGDFVLWKGNAVGDFWPSPWGHGRPGWHIECSTFIKEFFGDTVDIHGGGEDLIFPHHENERAQSLAFSGSPFVRYWLHNAHVTLKKEKMSKSTGNFFTLRDIFRTVDPMVLRFYFLQHHYRTPLDFSIEQLKSAERAYRKLIKLFSVEKRPELDSESIKHHAKLTVSTFLEFEQGDGVLRSVVDALLDDFNTPKLLGLLFANIDTIGAHAGVRQLAAYLVQEVLGLSCEPLAEKEQVITQEVKKLIALRTEARVAKKWDEADLLRKKLHDLGYTVADKKV